MSIYIIKGDMSVCLSVADGRPNGWADQDQNWDRDSCWPKECFSQGQGQGHLQRPAGPREQRPTGLRQFRPEDRYLQLVNNKQRMRWKWNYNSNPTKSLSIRWILDLWNVDGIRQHSDLDWDSVTSLITISLNHVKHPCFMAIINIYINL